MPTWYQCDNPLHPEALHCKYYDETERPEDGFCPACPPWEGTLLRGEGPRPPCTYHDAGDSHEGSHERVPLGAEIGLCIIACDVSRSMNNVAFPNAEVRKIDAVAGAAALGIASLFDDTASSGPKFSAPDRAFVALVAFGAKAILVPDRDGKPFLKSISRIQAEYKDAEGLGRFLAETLKPDTGAAATLADSDSTNITNALSFAHKISASAHDGSLTQFGLEGSVILMHHDVPDLASILPGSTEAPRTRRIPNIRTLIYSDGAHQPADGTPLENAFSVDDPSTLMTMFFGEVGDRGVSQMRSLACTCPAHQMPGFFHIRTSEHYRRLRYLFRMASGASGFCPSCLTALLKGGSEEGIASLSEPS